MKKIIQISLIVASVLVLSACNKEYEDITSDKGFKGVFVRNQAGSISYYSELDNTVTGDIYNVVNGADLGGPLTAFSISGKKGYLLKGANNDQKIETVDSETLMSEGVQGNFSNLTDLKAVSDTFVVVAQGVSGSESSGTVMVLDSKVLSNLVATIKVGKNPTLLAYSRGRKVYVANAGGGAYPDSTVMVIDIHSKMVTDTVALEQKVDELNTLKLKKPIDMVLDGYQNLWVLCAGEGGEGAGLAKISYGTAEVRVFPFENGYMGNGKNALATSSGGATIYFVNDGVYAIGYNDTALPTEKFFTESAYKDMVFDAIGINPYNGKFFCAKDGNGEANGSVYIFDKYGFITDNTAITVGKMPRQFVFVR